MNAALSPVQSSFDARALLAEFFGYGSFRPGQEETIRSIAQGGSTLAVMPTGSGKSLCYQLPALAAHGVTLVISPLIALMKDQIDELARLRIPAAFINSTLSLEAQRDRIAAVMAGEYRLLYVAPERFRSAAFRRMLEHASVPIVAVDEAHCVSEWGHDFRPDYLRLRGFFQSIAPASIVALTATATPKVQRDIVEQLGLGEARVIVTGFDRPNLLLAARRFVYDQEKQRFLLQFVRSRAGSGIVYAGSRRAAEELSDLLYSHGETVRCYHAGMKDADREEAQNAFMAGQARLIVATNAFGMGIDKPDIRFVFHYSMPGSAEAYYQEAGRAGRDGQPAECVLCSSPADYRLREFSSNRVIPRPKKSKPCTKRSAAQARIPCSCPRSVSGAKRA